MLARRYSNSTETTFVSDADAPWLSVTVTRSVKLLGSRVIYVCPLLIVPWQHVVPVVDEPSPQSIRYVHGPSLSGSLNVAFSVNSSPVNAVSSGPAFTVGGLFGGGGGGGGGRGGGGGGGGGGQRKRW